MKLFSSQDIEIFSRWLDRQDEFVFLDNARLSGEDHRSMLFMHPERWLVCQGPDGVEDFLREAHACQQKGSFLAGWIGYEFGYLLEPSLRKLCRGCEGPYAALGVFQDPLTIDHAEGGLSAIRELVGSSDITAPGTGRLADIHASIDRDEYLGAIRRIKEYIVAGDTYQVNYTLKLKFSHLGNAAPVYASLRRNQAVAYGAWIRQGGRDIMSFSPELFFRADPGRITVRPMKGTMQRGRTLDEDLRQRKVLQDDLKNRSENVMIVDLLRNDLGRLLHGTGGGTVTPRSMFDVETYETVLQMTSTIDGVPSRKRMPSLGEILRALFPCGSVTGAPKIRTMQIIRELEKEPRGVYCGAIGFYGPEETVFNVPIRTVVLENGRGEMGIGSGIVFDSDPLAEWEESMLKARFLSQPRPEFQLIETLLWQPGQGYWLLDEHLQRLADSAAYFLFRFDHRTILDTLDREALQYGGPMRVRLLLWRDGRIDIAAAELDQSFEPVVAPDEGPGSLPRVIFSKQRTDPDNIHLYHKTTERALYVDERERAVASGFHEVLFCNRQGEVTEGSVSNIFVRRGAELLTPPVRCGLLAGTFRRHLLAQGSAREQVVTRADVFSAEAVYIGNSVRGLVRVEVLATDD